VRGKDGFLVTRLLGFALSLVVEEEESWESLDQAEDLLITKSLQSAKKLKHQHTSAPNARKDGGEPER